MRATTSELRQAEAGLKEATPAELTTIDGGRMKIPGVHQSLPLVGPDGQPLSVYVDGIRVSRY